MTGLVLFGCFPYTTQIRSRPCLRRGGHSSTSVSPAAWRVWQSCCGIYQPAPATLERAPAWPQPFWACCGHKGCSQRLQGTGSSHPQASNIPVMKSLSSHTSGKCYRGKIRHPATNKYWKQDCFRAGWELKSSRQIKSLTKIHLSVRPSAEEQAHQHLVFSVSFHSASCFSLHVYCSRVSAPWISVKYLLTLKWENIALVKNFHQTEADLLLR